MNTKNRRFHRQLIQLSVQLEPWPNPGTGCFKEGSYCFRKEEVIGRKEEKRRKREGMKKKEEKQFWKERERKEEGREGGRKKEVGKIRGMEGQVIRWVINFAQIYFAWQVSWYICHVDLCLVDSWSQNKIIYFFKCHWVIYELIDKGLRSFILELLKMNCVWENQGLVQIISTVQRSVTWRKLVYQFNSLVTEIYAYHKNILIQQFRF